MSILKEADFYYGAVLSTLINRGICPALVESGKDRQIYDFVTNKKEFRLFVKYRSRPINTKTPEYSSWQFHFSDDDKRELTLFMSDEKHLSVGLVCGEDQLNKSQYAVVLNDGGKGAQFRRNGCSICAVEVRNLARNTHRIAPGINIQTGVPNMQRCGTFRNVA